MQGTIALRHTFATRLLDAKQNLKVIQSLMGHSSIAITADTYIDISMNPRKMLFQPLVNIL